MELKEIIKEYFNKGFFDKAMLITGLPDAYPAWTIKHNDSVSVAVPVSYNGDFSEEFENIDMRILREMLIDGEQYDIVMLTLHSMELRDEFAAVCESFVDPGKDGENRRLLSENPTEWWEKWKTLLGNVSKNFRPYSILGEMVAVNYFLKRNRNPVWAGKDGNVHDIEFADYACEVKSTIRRYGSFVEISSVYQMNHATCPLDLIFCRFEQSEQGISINSEAEELVANGYDESQLEMALKSFGLEKGRTSRNRKYRLLEMKLYHVDDSFPAITEESFKNNSLPEQVVAIKYTVDLSGLESENLLAGEN